MFSMRYLLLRVWLAAAAAVLLAAAGGSVGVHAGGVRGQHHHHHHQQQQQQHSLLAHNNEDGFSSFKQLKAVVGAIEGTVLKQNLMDAQRTFKEGHCHVAKAKPGVFGAIKKGIADLKGVKADPTAGEVAVGAAQKLGKMGLKEGLRAVGGAEVAGSIGPMMAGTTVVHKIGMNAKKEWESGFSTLNFETWLFREAHRMQTQEVAKETSGTPHSVNGMMDVLQQQRHPVSTEYPNVVLARGVSFENKNAKAAAILDAFASSSAWMKKWVAEVTNLAIAFQASFGTLDRAVSTPTSSGAAGLAKAGVSIGATLGAATPGIVKTVGLQ